MDQKVDLVRLRIIVNLVRFRTDIGVIKQWRIYIEVIEDEPQKIPKFIALLPVQYGIESVLHVIM